MACLLYTSPVIQARPLEFFVVNGKAQRPHQVEAGPGGRTGAGDVAGILGNLGLNQNNVQSWHRGYHHPYGGVARQK